MYRTFVFCNKSFSDSMKLRIWSGEKNRVSIHNSYELEEDLRNDIE